MTMMKHSEEGRGKRRQRERKEEGEEEAQLCLSSERRRSTPNKL